MSGPGEDQGRLRRILRLRRAWRRSGTEEDQRRDEALDSNDRIRAEAPDDLETRRRADQLEREIKRPH